MVEIDFLTSGNYFFVPIWDTPATANFNFWSNGNVFLNAFRLVESDFLARGNAFFNYLLDILAIDSFFLV